MPLILGGNLSVIITALLHKSFPKLRRQEDSCNIELYNHGTNKDIAIKYNDFVWLMNYY